MTSPCRQSWRLRFPPNRMPAPCLTTNTLPTMWSRWPCITTVLKFASLPQRRPPVDSLAHALVARHYSGNAEGALAGDYGEYRRAYGTVRLARNEVLRGDAWRALDKLRALEVLIAA
jgi:hypothetical protein